MNQITLNITDDQTKRILKILGEEKPSGLSDEALNSICQNCDSGLAFDDCDCKPEEKKEECKRGTAGFDGSRGFKFRCCTNGDCNGHRLA